MDSNPGNIATYQTDNNANSNYNKSDITENFDYSKVQKEEEKAVGSVIPEETSGAITLLYGNKVKDNSGLTPEFLQEVKFIASSATGIPVENISVTTLRLEQAEVVPPVFGEKAKDFVDDYGIMILLLILTLGLVAAIISSAAPSRTTDLAVEQVASSDGSTFSVSTADFQESILGNDRRGMELPEISVDEGSEVKRHIESFVKQKPEAAAQLLRNWLTED